MNFLTADIARLTDIVKGMEKGKVIARKTNGERTTENMTCRRVTGDKVTVEKEGDKGTEVERSRCDRRKDEGKKESESKCDQTEVNFKDDDMKKRGRRERNNRESIRGKVSNQRYAKRRSYSEAVIEGALKTERVFMGDSILRRTLNKGEDVVFVFRGLE